MGILKTISPTLLNKNILHSMLYKILKNSFYYVIMCKSTPFRSAFFPVIYAENFYQNDKLIYLGP